MKDRDDFLRKLNRPSNPMKANEEVRQEEAADFASFAAAFGVAPPQPEDADA